MSSTGKGRTIWSSMHYHTHSILMIKPLRIHAFDRKGLRLVWARIWSPMYYRTLSILMIKPPCILCTFKPDMILIWHHLMLKPHVHFMHLQPVSYVMSLCYVPLQTTHLTQGTGPCLGSVLNQAIIVVSLFGNNELKVRSLRATPLFNSTLFNITSSPSLYNSLIISIHHRSQLVR